MHARNMNTRFGRFFVNPTLHPLRLLTAAAVGRGGGHTHVMHGRRRMPTSHPHNAGTEHVTFSPNRKTSLAPSATCREVLVWGGGNYVTSSVVQVHTPVVLPVRRLLPYTRYHAPEAQRARAKFDRKLRHVFSRCIRNKFDRRNGGQGSAVILNPAQLLIIVAKSSMWPMVATKQEI